MNYSWNIWREFWVGPVFSGLIYTRIYPQSQDYLFLLYFFLTMIISSGQFQFDKSIPNVLLFFHVNKAFLVPCKRRIGKQVKIL